MTKSDYILPVMRVICIVVMSHFTNPQNKALAVLRRTKTTFYGVLSQTEDDERSIVIDHRQEAADSFAIPVSIAVHDSATPLQ